MLAAVLHAPGDLRFEERPDPAPGPGEVVLQVLAAAVCGSDRKTYREGHPRVRLPRILGHEACGVVEAAGAGVPGLRSGDRAALQPAFPDGVCERCRAGMPDLCERPSLLGYHHEGAFAERLVLPAAAVSRGCLVPVPRDLSDDEAALGEPLGCALHALSFLRAPEGPGRFGPRFAPALPAGAAVAVFGGGPMGCLLVLSLKWMGARAYLLEADPDRLPVAFDACRPDGVLAIPRGEGEAAGASIRAFLKAATGSELADAAVVACSDPGAQRIACDVVRRGATVSLFGGLPDGAPARLPANRIHYRSLTVAGASGCSAACLREALDLVAAGEIDVEPVISRRLGLFDLQAGLAGDDPAVLKTVIRPAG